LLELHRLPLDALVELGLRDRDGHLGRDLARDADLIGRE